MLLHEWVGVGLQRVGCMTNCTWRQGNSKRAHIPVHSTHTHTHTHTRARASTHTRARARAPVAKRREKVSAMRAVLSSSVLPTNFSERPDAVSTEKEATCRNEIQINFKLDLSFHSTNAAARWQAWEMFREGEGHAKRRDPEVHPLIPPPPPTPTACPASQACPSHGPAASPELILNL
jgi:hypothetical protein